YHGYATTDYYRIDPRFGTNEEWNTLIAEAHEKGLKVVMDMIFNHSGSAHPWLKNMPAADWYNHHDGQTLTNFRLSTLHDPYVSDYDLDHTVNGWFVPDMPDLNQRNPHLMKYLTQNSIWWIESSKIDGIRMDTYPYADMKAMSQWAKDVLAEYPGFNIVGECWYGNEAGGAFWQAGNRINPVETNLPTVMDFKLSIDKDKMFNEETDPWNGLNHLYDHLALDYLYPDPQHILTFLDNHDTDRFLAELPSDLGSWKQAMAFLLTSRGIPQLYYGTELLMHGSKKITDGDIRLDMPGGFPGDTIDAFTPEGRTPLQNEAWNYLSRLLNWRRGEANDVIARGSLKHFMPQNGIYAYERRLADRQVVVLLNGTGAPLTTSMERTAEILPYGTTLTDIVTGKPVTITETMTFSPRQVMILQNF
ncbi:MAG: cyclomaltodextrinase C-terminal domain-containing protein, partial [Muribaculaceae bacterium]|nr:cyclomaltodextrinase C-terminal domain-containing protein [Muribaculaceae bacterium]